MVLDPEASKQYDPAGIELLERIGSSLVSSQALGAKGGNLLGVAQQLLGSAALRCASCFVFFSPFKLSCSLV